MKKLQLNRETLAELSPDDLASIEGGVILTPVINTVPLNRCLATKFNCWNSEPCPGTSMC